MAHGPLAMGRAGSRGRWQSVDGLVCCGRSLARVGSHLGPLMAHRSHPPPSGAFPPLAHRPVPRAPPPGQCSASLGPRWLPDAGSCSPDWSRLCFARSGRPAGRHDLHGRPRLSLVHRCGRIDHRAFSRTTCMAGQRLRCCNCWVEVKLACPQILSADQMLGPVLQPVYMVGTSRDGCPASRPSARWFCCLFSSSTSPVPQPLVFPASPSTGAQCRCLPRSR